VGETWGAAIVITALVDGTGNLVFEALFNYGHHNFCA
jgi:hypothetical protein